MNTISTDINCQYKIDKSGQHYNLLCDGHHFLTIINQLGTFNLRAHPGKDPNGWGTSVYLQPFFPGASLHSSVIKEIDITKDGITVHAEGVVCKDAEQTIGMWKIQLLISYNPSSSSITGTGTYSIQLPSPLSDIKAGDLNLMRIASNYLWNVPLITGGTGNTGDMSSVDIVLDGQTTAWIPQSEETTVVNDTVKRSRSLQINVNGGTFLCDSRKQGFDPVSSQLIYKPTTRISLSSSDKILGIFAMMSTFRDELASKQYGRDVYLHEEYWQDNIGVSPLVYESENSQEFSFDLEFSSASIEPVITQ